MDRAREAEFQGHIEECNRRRVRNLDPNSITSAIAEFNNEAVVERWPLPKAIAGGDCRNGATLREGRRFNSGPERERADKHV
ncbi:Protein of unknown function [Gryllus bimaculatus]|nr:Protein of unknown function [Gryllus bimaculatus]